MSFCLFVVVVCVNQNEAKKQQDDQVLLSLYLDYQLSAAELGMDLDALLFSPLMLASI